MTQNDVLLVREVIVKGSPAGHAPARTTQVTKVRIQWPAQLPELPTNAVAGEWRLVDDQSLWKLKSKRQIAHETARAGKKIRAMYCLSEPDPN